MQLFVSAFGLGLTFFATPGAITAQLLRGWGQRGFLGTILLQLGALLGLLLWASVALAGAAFLVQNTFARILLGILGILLLLYLAWLALKDAYRGGEKKTQESQRRTEFALGAALTLANPFPVIFWLSILPTLIANEQVSLDFATITAFFAGFIMSAVLWSLLMAGLLAWGRRFVTPSFLRLINLICGLALVFFAFKLLWDILQQTGV
jgi:threonine/homoserine/homoserine lactone efflux protein